MIPYIFNNVYICGSWRWFQAFPNIKQDPRSRVLVALCFKLLFCITMKLFYKPTFFCILIQIICSNIYVHFILRSGNFTNIYYATYLLISSQSEHVSHIFLFWKIFWGFIRIHTYLLPSFFFFFFFVTKRCSAIILLKLSMNIWMNIFVWIFFTLTVQTLSRRVVKSKQCSPTVIAIARS